MRSNSRGTMSLVDALRCRVQNACRRVLRACVPAIVFESTE